MQGIQRTLRDGGVLHVEVLFLFAFHADPEDWTLPGLCRMWESFGFRQVRAGVRTGPASALAVFPQNFFSPFAPAEFLRKAVKAGARLGLFWRKYLDYLLIRHPLAHLVAAACYFVGIKAPPGPESG